MSSISIMLILSAVALNSAAQVLLKAGTNVLGTAETATWTWAVWRAVTEWHIGFGLLAYAAAFVVWVLALARMQLSVAYPMLSLSYVINAFAARALFGEPLSLSKVAGIGCVLFGVSLLGFNQPR